MWKKMTAVALAVCMLCTLIVPAFGAKKLHYDSVVFLGDSISQGFTMLEGIDNAYDYYDHLLSQEVGEEALNGAEGNPYVNAYPYVFAKLAGTNLKYAYNYGIAGGMADDIAVLLSADIDTIKGTYDKTEEEWVGGSAFSDIGTMNQLRADFAKAIGRDETLHNFVTDLRENVKSSDLIAVSSGGNDVYQNFMMSIQNPDSMEKIAEMGALGLIVNIVTILMQFETSWEDIFETFNSLSDWLTPAKNQNSGDQNNALQAESNDEGGMDLSSLISLDAVKQLVNYFSKENIQKVFFEAQEGYEKSVIEDWKDAYEKIVASISKMNPNADIALISQYNPFGIQNYIGFIRQRVESGELLQDLELDAYTAARVVKTLLTGLTEVEKNQNDANQVSEILTKMLTSLLNQLLPSIGEKKEIYEYTYYNSKNELTTKESTLTPKEYQAEHPDREFISSNTGKTKLTFTEKDNAALYELVQDLCYPVMTLMVGTGLQTVYDEMNAHLQKLAMKYSKATYVDITDAPASGRLDPHPGAAQHKWIADRIYDELSDAVNSPLYNSTISKIIEAASKTSNFIRTLLHIPGQSLVDQVIDGVQEITARVQSIMAIPKMMTSLLFPFLSR